MGTTCARCGAEAADDARFCATCGAPLAVGGPGERKLATILFADLVGSTELIAGRDPESMRTLLAPFFELARSTVQEHGGQVEKFIGDAVMGVFGVPRAHGDDPDRAVAAALALIERLGEQTSDLRLRVGIETGEVLVNARDLTVTGEAAHAAARLETAARPGEVLIGDRTAQACRRSRLGDRRMVDAKGFDEPLVAWIATGTDVGGEGHRTPFLGRGGELETLRLAHLGAVRERSPRLVLIVGEAGAGKTRLATELLDSLAAAEPAPTVLAGRNPPYGDGIAFWALGEILRGAAGASPDAGSIEVRDGLRARLTAQDTPYAEETARALAGTLTAESGEIGDVGGLRRAWRRLLASLSREAPVVVAIDDVQWADLGFLDLIDDAVSLPDCPITIICTARPEIDARRAHLGDGAGRERLELGPLSRTAATELAATLVEVGDAGLAAEIAAASGGNPFFAEEIAHALGASRQDAVLPDTVQTAIAARLDALGPGEKQALQRASVLGDRFVTGALAELSEDDPQPTLARLEELALIERLAGERDLFGFRHQLIREVAYSTLTRVERVRLHQLAAEGIRARAGDRWPELAEVVAYHLANAADLEPGPERAARAYSSLLEAAGFASQRSAAARSQELLERAAGFAADSEQAIDALARAAEVAMSRVRGDETLRLFTALAEVLIEAGQPQRAAFYYARCVEIATRMPGITGVLPETEILSMRRRADELAPRPEGELAVQLRLDDVWLAWRGRDNEEVAAAAADALELARAAGDLRLLSSALDAASATAWTDGRFAEAVGHSRERVETLQALADRHGFLAFELADALNMLSSSLIYAGQLREGVRWAERYDTELTVNAPHIAGAVILRPLYMLGDWDAALDRGAEVRESWLADGRPPVSFFAPNLACLAAIHGLRGDEAEQRAWLEIATEAAADSVDSLPGVTATVADVALHRGELDRAAELLPAPPEGAGWAPMVLAKRAEALVLAGDPEAGEALERARAERSADAHTSAVALRAQALFEDDDAMMQRAEGLFAEQECAYELARTRWLRGGPHREAAREGFARLGAVEPD